MRARSASLPPAVGVRRCRRRRCSPPAASGPSGWPEPARSTRSGPAAPTLRRTSWSSAPPASAPSSCSWLGLGVTLAALAPSRERSAGSARWRPSTSPPPRSGGYGGRVGAALATAATPAWRTRTARSPAPPAHADQPDQTAAAGTRPGVRVTVRAPVVDAVPDPGTTTGPVATVPDPGFGAGIRTAPATTSAPGPSATTTTAPAPTPAEETRTPPALGPLGPAPHTPSPSSGARDGHRGPWRQPLGHRGAAARAAGDRASRSPASGHAGMPRTGTSSARTRTSSASARC